MSGRYTHLDSIKVDGIASTSQQGALIGASKVMPQPSADLDGVTIQYMGPTDSTYTFKCMYTCAMVGSEYKWIDATPVDIVQNSNGVFIGGTEIGVADSTKYGVMSPEQSEKVDTSFEKLETVKEGAEPNKVDIIRVEGTPLQVSGVDKSVNITRNSLGLGDSAQLDVGTLEGQIPVLGANGQLPKSTIPPYATGTYVGSVRTKALLTSLTTAEIGDWAKVTSDDDYNNNGVYILNGTAPEVLTNWVQMVGPANVESVNGKSGRVVLDKEDIGLANVDNTSDADKPISTATQSALDAKADTTALTAHTLSTSNPHKVTKAQVGLGNADDTSDLDKPISTATQTALDAKADRSPTEAHIASTANPHRVTKAQVGLGNCDNTSDADKPISTATQTALNLKVDKVSGKGLSTNDYTDADKTKLAGIAPGAQVNVVETVKVNGTALTPTEKAVDVTVPTKVSQITNDTGFITKAVSDLANYYLKTETYTKAEVQGLIAAIPLFSVTTVDALPTTGDPLKIYFVPKAGSANDAHDEFIWVDGSWEIIGTTTFVLTIDQDASGVSINGTALQKASSAQSGLMTPDHIALIGTKADTTALSGYVPVSRTVNGHALSDNINITAGDVGALPSDTYIPPEITIDEELTSTSPNPVSSRAIYQKIMEAGETIAVSTHIADKSNPHAVTKAQVGLGNCDNTADLDKPISTATQSALDGKVDAVTGKGLSTEDYTTAEKNKLAGISAGAQVNVIEGVKVNGVALTPTDKIVDVTVPTDTADLTNGADFATMTEVTTAVSPKADASDLTAHTGNRSNPHGVTKSQIGLGNVDNTTDLAKPISTATQTALDLKASASDLSSHVADKTNPHAVTKAQVGLGSVDNTSDADKPVSTAQQNALNLKVDKVTGKGLSTEDFTSNLKTKLSDLYTKAQIDSLISAIPKYAVTVVDALPTTGISTTTIYLVPKTGSGKDVHDEYLYIDGAWELIGTTAFNLEISQTSTDITINGTALQKASTSVSGLMTSAQVTALNASATASALSAHTSDKSNPHNVTKAQIGLGNVDNTSDMAKPISTATQTALNAKANNSDLSSHVANKSNPHAVTKAQVGLGSVDNTSDLDKPISTATQTALDGKVDKVSGKGLSTNDYTTAEKNKLAGISAGAQVNVIEGVKVNGVALTPTDKIVDVTVPTDTADLTNGADFATMAEVTSAVSSKAESSDLTAHTSRTDNPHKVTKAQVGLGNVDNTSDASKPISTATQSALDGKVDKVSGKGLSTNDYTTAEKNKLSGIASGAQVNVIESVKVNGTALTPTSKAVNIDLSNYATKGDVSAIPKFAISVVTTLPASGISTSTIYLKSNGGSSGNSYDEYIYVNNAWEKIGTTEVDLSGYVPTSRTVNGKALTGNITLVASDVSAVPTTRKVNNKALSADITLTAGDVGALPAGGTAVKATADASGNNIVNTYATKTELTNGLAGKQNALTFDSAPTSGSSNPVTSGGVHSAIDGKADATTVETLTNTVNGKVSIAQGTNNAGKVLGINSSGNVEPTEISGGEVWEEVNIYNSTKFPRNWVMSDRIKIKFRVKFNITAGNTWTSKPTSILIDRNNNKTNPSIIEFSLDPSTNGGSQLIYYKSTTGYIALGFVDYNLSANPNAWNKSSDPALCTLSGIVFNNGGIVSTNLDIFLSNAADYIDKMWRLKK